jgi:hypothetical protein
MNTYQIHMPLFTGIVVSSLVGITSQEMLKAARQRRIYDLEDGALCQ